MEGTCDGVLSLQALVARDAAVTDEACRQFSACGWCLVELPKELVALMLPLVELLKLFFDKPLKEKEACAIHRCFGYNFVSHKEGLRYLSSRLKEIPVELRDLHPLIRAVDGLLRGVVGAISETAFGLKVDAFEKDFPLMRSGGEAFSLVDIVRYPNNAAAGRARNCEPHYDPGLISLSFLSTHHGLQLLNSNGEFVAPPLQSNIGVLWLGEAAQRLSKSKVRAGIHQVLSSTCPRLTCWAEVCTMDQVSHLLLPIQEQEEGKEHVETFPFRVANIVGQSIDFVVQVAGGAGAALRAKLKAGKQVEEETGLAMSKPIFTLPNELK